MINLYTIRLTAVKSVKFETIRKRRNSESDSNDNFYPHGVFINEQEELEVIWSSKITTYLYKTNI